MVDSYDQAPSKEAKLAILSLFAPYFPIQTTIKLFHVDGNDVHKAKLHDADVGGGVQAEKEMHERFRGDPKTFAFMFQWIRSDYGSVQGACVCLN